MSDRKKEEAKHRKAFRDALKRRIAIGESGDSGDLYNVEYGKGKWGSRDKKLTDMSFRELFAYRDTMLSNQREYNKAANDIIDAKNQEATAWNKANADDIKAGTKKEKGQKKHISQSSALGKYQFMKPALLESMKGLGLSMGDKFSADTQENIMDYYMGKYGVDDFLKSSLSKQDTIKFKKAISKKWASIADESGKGAYDGDGINNASQTLDREIEALIQGRQAAADREATRMAEIKKYEDTLLGPTISADPRSAPDQYPDSTKIGLGVRAYNPETKGLGTAPYTPDITGLGDSYSPNYGGLGTGNAYKDKLEPPTNNSNMPKDKQANSIQKKYAEGGMMDENQDSKLTQFNGGGTHEQNPLGGIPLGQDTQGTPNSVEDGETKKKVEGGDYIYSDRINVKSDKPSEFFLPNYVKGKTFAEASKKIEDRFKDRSDNDSNRTKEALLSRLADAQERTKLEMEADEAGITVDELIAFKKQQAAQAQQQAQKQQQAAQQAQMTGEQQGQQAQQQEQPQMPQGQDMQPQMQPQMGAQMAYGGHTDPTKGIDPTKKNGFTDKEMQAFGDNADYMNMFFEPDHKAPNSPGRQKWNFGAFNHAFKSRKGTDTIDVVVPEYYNSKKAYEYLQNLNPGREMKFNRSTLKHNNDYNNSFAEGGFTASGAVSAAGGAYQIVDGNLNAKKQVSIGGAAAKGALTGAAMGSVVPGIGTAIGAGIGGLAGGASAFFNNKKIEEQQLNASMEAGAQTTQVDREAQAQMAYGGKMNQYPDGGGFDIGKPFRKYDNQYTPSYNNDYTLLGGTNGNENQFDIGAPFRQDYSYSPRVDNNSYLISGESDKGNSKGLGVLGAGMSLAPAVGNFIAGQNIDRPEANHIQNVGRTYTPQYADERAAMNVINEGYSGSNQALANATNGDLGAYRASLMGNTVGKTGALGEAYRNIELINRGERKNVNADIAAARKEAVDNYNLEQDYNKQDTAAYDAAKAKYRTDMYSSIGKLGETLFTANQMGDLTSYDWLTGNKKKDKKA